jgi:tetratricopeptide (TPR) repeat protein
MPTRENLDEILRARGGDLQETPYAVLLLALALRERTAVLELRRTPLEKKIVFDAGSPVDCRSNIATETLGRFLVAQGRISEQDCHAALNQSTSRGVPLGEILIERKLLAPTELYRVLQQNLGRKLLEPFSWKSGSWSISYDVPPAASALRVKAPQLIVTGIVKVEEQESADAAVSIAHGKYLAIASDPLFALGDVRFTKEQQSVVDAAKKGMAFDVIREKSGIDPDDLNRIVYALMLLGIVSVTDQPVIWMPPFETAAAPVVASAPPPTISANADEVMNAYLSFRRKDPFDFFALPEEASLPDVIHAYLSTTEKFLPANFPVNASDGLHDKAQEVFLAAARAYAELADPERRDRIVKRRQKLREEEAAAAQRSAAALIDPEELCKTGRGMMAAGKTREALSSFEMAAECDAQNGTYAAEVAWCRYLLRVSPAPMVMKMLKNAIRIDPNASVAYLYAGQVQSVLGHKLEAEAFLNRAAMLMPKDLRVVEAFKRLPK